MRYSTSFIATNKEAKKFDSINATLLQKGSFIEQTMAGVYTYLPLGLRVLENIENIVRQEMDTIGTEILLPALSPTSLWERTGRLDSVDVLFEARGGNELSRKMNDATYVLGFTHEEVITAIVSKYKLSYRDLPVSVYQIQTKFRNEARPKSGILRGREFRMKDLYSFHASKADLDNFYEESKNVYSRVFDRLGIGDDTVIAQASGGDFTDQFSHEFQTKCDTGEDTIFVNKETGEAFNKEVITDADTSIYETFQASEVGNIYRFDTKYADAFDYRFTDQNGERQPVYTGSYGIGTTRIMGVLVEKFHDDAGIMWPAQVAPFTVHLVGLNLDDSKVQSQAESVYEELRAAGIQTLFDDRVDVSPGEKLADADLIGCPWRVIVSTKTGGQIETKERAREEVELVTVPEFISQLGAR